MSQDSINALINSIHSINTALKEHDFDAVIYETFLGVDELLPKIHMSFLEQRVKAYELKGDLDQAYVTSLVMTKAFPKFISGYLHASRILVQQRKFEQAIDMCQEGVEEYENMSSPVIDPEYQELLQVQQIAEKGRYKKVDFMSTVPYDVILLILKYLSMNDLINCMKVTRAWKETVLSCPSSFREWNPLPPQDLRYYDATEYDIIQQLSTHIWSLNVVLLWEQSAEQLLKNLLANMTFPHLRSFTFYFSKASQEALHNVLKVASDSLEEVFISFGNPYDIIPGVGDRKICLNEIFDLCPNLKKLTYDTPGILEYYGASLLDNLTELHIYGGEVLWEEVQYILWDTPNVQELSIGQCDHKVLNVLHKCNNNKLRSISINPDRFQPDCLPSSQIQKQTYDRMIDAYHCFDVTAPLLLPLLEKHKYTEALTLSVTPTVSNNIQKWKAFATFKSSYLRYLMVGFTDDLEYIFASAIKNCTNLEVVKIRGSNPSKVTYDALESLGRLRRLELTNNNEISSNFQDDHALRSFFEYHAGLGDKSTLEEVNFNNYECVQASTISILSKIKNLKSIELAGTFLEDEMMNVNTAMQAIALASLPLLDSVFLEDIPIADDGIKKLDCRHIRLVHLENVTTSGLQDLITHSRRLRLLDVVGCENIGVDAVLQLLKRKNILFGDI